MTMKKRLISLLITLCCISYAFAQFGDPVQVKATIKETSPSEAVITFAASIKSGWHMYSTEVVEDGPTPTTLKVEKINGAKLDGALKPVSKPVKKYEEMFGADVYFFEQSATYTQKIRLLGGKYEIEGYLEYGACNDRSCIPPTAVDFSFSGEVAVQKEAANDKDVKPVDVDEAPSDEKADEIVESASDSLEVKKDSAVAAADWWKAVDFSEYTSSGEVGSGESSLWYIFGIGFFGGLLALLTPCVWPVIPMTVSFFLKKGTTKKSTPEQVAAAKKRGVRDAMLYGLSIVVIYVALGLVITALFGASALNDLATNAVFNIIFFLMLLLFGASFIGGFEITLPSSWNNAIDSKASSTTGLLSVFLMAFTLVLVSFSCTGPIIGFLLVQVVTSDILGPVIGMLGFSVGLALPFSFFALFPALLKSVPKSGNWMNVVKVTLGFVELAFSLKFLSVADLAYGKGLLDREVFLSLWIALAVLLGAYLIGWIRFPHDEDEFDEMGNVVVKQKTSVPRFFMALVAFAFAVYMIPGLWGAPLKAISAFTPPMKTQDFNLAEEKEVKPMFTDYGAGMEYAKQHKMPVMLDFTGYGCVNCREMEANVFVDPTVADIMQRDYVLIQLYVDDKASLPETVEVGVGGTVRKLRTVGDKWSYLQSSKFGANAQPFYVLLDNEGEPLERAYSYDDDVDEFVKWLRSGLANYTK